MSHVQMYATIVVCLIATAVSAGPPPSQYELISSPTSENFNGISATADGSFVVAVGNNGAIVHFVDGDAGALMPSGTTRDLFDVFVRADDFAVVTGEEIVLLWDGSSWEAVQSSPGTQVYTGTWISPEQDIVLYGTLGSQFSFVCPYDPNATQQGFCRTFGRPMLTACGVSGDIKLVNADGDIFNVNNGLGDINGFDPIHDEMTPLGLTAAWIPDNGCLPGPFPPLVAYAIRGGNQFWKFDGTQWVNMNIPVPGDQTIVWLDGTEAEGLAVAVGFKPATGGGFDGVLWNSDGATWVEETNLPAGVPGMMDIAVSEQPYVELVHADGFETVAAAKIPPPEAFFEAMGAGDEGDGLRSSSGSRDDPPPRLAISKSIVGSTPTMTGQSVTYRIEITNHSPTPAVDARLYDQFGGISFDSGTCGSSEVATNFGNTRRVVMIPMIAFGSPFLCEMTFTVTAGSGQGFTNLAIATPSPVYDDRFGRVSDSVNVIIP